MSATRDTGFLRNVIQVHDTGVRIMSGSTMLMAVSSSGAVTITGEMSGSDAANALLLSGTGSVGFTTTGSFLAVSSSQQQISSSYISLSASYNTFSGSASTRTTQIENVYATTGSNSFRADQSITGSLVVSSTITAQTLVVQTVTSSIVYSSGSNIFGSALTNTQTFTGSLFITGSNITANVDTTCFSGNVCALNLISRCNIRVGVNGGYAVISGPTTGAAISLGSNSATFDRNLSLGLMAGDFTFSPVLTINAQTSNVGILNCTPDRRLYVADTSVTQGTFLAYNQCTTFCGTVIEGITDRTSNCAFNLMNLKASTTSMFLVRGDGNIGVGTCAPLVRLHVGDGTQSGINGAGNKIHIASNTSGGRSALLTLANSSGAVTVEGQFESSAESADLKVIIGSTSNHDVVLRTNNAERMRIVSTGITTFACRVCISVGRTSGADSTALILQDNVTGVQAPGYGLRLVYQSNGTGVQSAIGLENGGTGTNNESQISFYTQNGAGGLGKRLLLTSGGDAGFGGSICAGSINSYSGIISSNGVITYSVGGTMVGTTAAYYDFPTWNDGGQGQMFEIKAFFDHFYNWAYGAHYYVYLTTRETLSQALTMFSCPTGNGGSWMAYKSSTTNLRVCKLAGTYPGGGAYWIQVTAKQA